MTVRSVLVRSLLALALLPGASGAPSPARDGANRSAKLVIGTMRVPPFVLRSDDGRWSGLSVELWNQIAAELKLPFEFREYDYNLPGLLDAVEGNQIDAAVAAIPVTLEGEARFDYSHTYLAAGLGIAVRAEPQNMIMATMASLVSYQALGTIGTLARAAAFRWRAYLVAGAPAERRAFRPAPAPWRR